MKKIIFNASPDVIRVEDVDTHAIVGFVQNFVKYFFVQVDSNIFQAVCLEETVCPNRKSDERGTLKELMSANEGIDFIYFDTSRELLDWLAE